MRQPNLLFIFTDEQRYDTLAAYGNGHIQMPNLDRLAGQSCVFDRAYVTQAVCTPSRATLLTGLWPHASGCTENNVALRPQTQCLPEMLRDEYVTGYYGKWHLGDEIFPQHGFEHWRSVEDLYRKYYTPSRNPNALSTYHQWLVERGVQPQDGKPVFGRDEVCRLPEELTKPKYLADESCEFIRANAGRPWVLFVNFLEPHMPFFGPRDGQYDPTDVTLPPNFDCVPMIDQPLKTRLFYQHYYRKGHSGLGLRTEADWRRMIANYWGLCSLVDTHAGRMLAALDDSGQADDTIVVFTSDHGDMMGSHRMLAKCTQFEEALRVPLLVRLPGQRKQKRIARPVSQIDLVPTLLDLMGQPVAGHLQGGPLRGLLESPGEHAGGDVFVEWNGPNSGISGDVLGKVVIPDSIKDVCDLDDAAAAVTDPVRTVITPDGWKLNVSPARGEHELYNLNSDPHETRNLAADAASRPVMNDLLGRIRNWQRRTGDAVPLPDAI